MAENKTYEVLYNDEVVATVAPGEKVEMHCAGQTMEYSLVVRPVADKPVMISFTIAGTSYQAEEGMNWYDWCYSDYNTSDNWLCSDLSSIVQNAATIQVQYNNVTVIGSDIIVGDRAYTTYQYNTDW